MRCKNKRKKKLFPMIPEMLVAFVVLPFCKRPDNLQPKAERFASKSK